MQEQNKNDKQRSTDLSKHKRDGKTLLSPFGQMENIRPSSWKDDRMPEMLWAVLLVGNLKREEALEVFRTVATFVQAHPELSDITLSGIASWPKEKRNEFVKLLSESHSEASRILRPLVALVHLPALDEWVKVLGNATDDGEVADYLAKGVVATLWHQSQEATDCRWVKFLCQIHGGKISFPVALKEKVRSIFEYPNYGDMREIRPFIRASEIAMNMPNQGKVSEWPEKFWKACLQNTLCTPIPREKQRKDSMKVTNDQVNRIRHLLLLHYLKTDESSGIEAKHDTIFGIGFYALRLLDELVATNLSRGMLGRLTLRTVVECYISLSYLVAKDDETIWNDFRNYGIGKMKLSYLKTRDLKDKPTFIDEEFLKEITNEDRWEEFSNIDLGHWDDSDLRKMSETANCKDIYDAYYDWTSSFSHANWGAIRESNFAMCANPLHRLHLIPSVIVYPLPGVLEDVVKITNRILNLIESRYPDLNCEIINESKPEEKVSWLKDLYSKIRYRKMNKLLRFITGQ